MLRAVFSMTQTRRRQWNGFHQAETLLDLKLKTGFNKKKTFIDRSSQDGTEEPQEKIKLFHACYCDSIRPECIYITRGLSLIIPPQTVMLRTKQGLGWAATRYGAGYACGFLVGSWLVHCELDRRDNLLLFCFSNATSNEMLRRVILNSSVLFFFLDFSIFAILG